MKQQPEILNGHPIFPKLNSYRSNELT